MTVIVVKTGKPIGVLINGTTIPDKWMDWKIIENKRGSGQQLPLGGQN